MSEILILESEKRYRLLLRFILEGINHTVLEAGDRFHMPIWTGGHTPDLLILGIHLEGELDDWPRWQRGLPSAPALILFSGDPILKGVFLKEWTGTMDIRCMSQPVDPYPFLAMVKSMLTTSVELRKGSQHPI